MSMMSGYYANQRANEHADASRHARRFGLSPRSTSNIQSQQHPQDDGAGVAWEAAATGSESAHSLAAHPTPIHRADPELAALVERAALQVNMLRLATDRADDADRRVATRVSTADELQSRLGEARVLTTRLASASALVERMEAVARRIDAIERDAERRASAIIDEHLRTIEQRLHHEADLIEARRLQATETLERLDRHLAQAAEQAEIQTRELSDRLEQRIGDQTRRICADAERRSADIRSELELILARTEERKSALESVCRHADRVLQGEQNNDQPRDADGSGLSIKTTKPAGLRGLLRLAESSSASLAQRIAKGDQAATKLLGATSRAERSAAETIAAAERAESTSAECRRTANDAQRKAEDIARRAADVSVQSERASASADRATSALRAAVEDGRSLLEQHQSSNRRAESITTTITSASERAEQLLTTLREATQAAHATGTTLESASNTSMDTVRRAERIATRLSAMLVKATIAMNNTDRNTSDQNDSIEPTTTPTTKPTPSPASTEPTPVSVRPQTIGTIRNVA